jgi:hemerythrin superfamily protein
MATKADTDATHLLSADHRKVEDLFEKFEKAKGVEQKETLAQQICNELKIHSMIEEEIFYPALEGKVDEDLLKEAYVEHDGAKVLINEIAAGGADEEFYDAKVTVLAEQSSTMSKRRRSSATTCSSRRAPRTSTSTPLESRCWPARKS